MVFFSNSSIFCVLWLVEKLTRGSNFFQSFKIKRQKFRKWPSNLQIKLESYPFPKNPVISFFLLLIPTVLKK
uniref:Uncharacterized protein n=1 Tax=Physcomitrium patens TaxID=3218 RepID=A0A2K1JTF4_PHYPA|nr:hypothetical protein PHYPA_014579 [Physcomitrium patens]